ncbi:hypothetical protein ACH5RR_034576 [Cinchona calisaya]|uniref:F-box/LRR-repeat protein n=1 Tax=Cinchona calisaya TaxID=153742 RepID=A0ABD2YEX5_9GENT
MSLRELILRCVNVTDKAIEFLLHNCPFLERLVVIGSNKFTNLLVSDPSLVLKHLEINMCSNIKSIKICNSNFVSLVISVVVENLILVNVPKVTELEILALKIDLENFVNVRDFPELSQLKHLQIDVNVWNDVSLMELTSLIKACPYLQNFVLKGSNRGHHLEDRINQLSDDILVLILSFLKLKEAAQTSVLSRRWTTLLMYIHRLDFDDPKALLRILENSTEEMTEMHSYVNWVNRILQLHKSSTVDEFRLCFPFEKFSLGMRLPSGLIVENLILMNVPELTEASVLRWRFVNWSHIFSQLSCCLSQLEILTLNIDTKIQVGARYDDSLMGLTSLIEACPYLQKFVLQDIFLTTWNN